MGTRGPRAAGRQNRRAVAFGVAAILVIGACSSDHDDAGTTSTATVGSTAGTSTTSGASTPVTDPTDPHGIQLVSGVRLGAGHAVAAPARPVPPVAGTPLDDAAAQAVIDRLPAWTTSDALTEAFKWPVESRGVPRPGATVDVPFPAPDQGPPPGVPGDGVATGPLHVLRTQPNGDVAIAPFASITFDQPMVPVATVAQLDAADVPATISPDIPGHWQWIGTTTLRFDATSDTVDRLPMATDFTITVPAGTTSATGGVLADPVTFSFSTPPVTVRSITPTGDSLSLAPVFLVAFDQRIDPQAVLASVHVTAGGVAVDVRLATADEIAADDAASQIVDSLAESRWIAFRPVDPFAPDAAIDIEIGPGAPSAEGPRLTTAAAGYSARTYAPLAVEERTCGYGSGCVPGSDFDITFNNGLDALRFDPASVTIDPPITGASIGASGNVIVIHGATQPRTEYTITLPAGLTDVYGQTLGSDGAVTLSVGAASPLLQQFSQPLTTLDPLATGASLQIATVNHHDARVRVFPVDPADWPAYVQFFVSAMQGNGDGLTPPWSAASDTVLSIDDNQDHLVETPLDLSGVLTGHGHAVVLVEPTEQYDINGPDYWNNRPTVTWVQQTAIGVDAVNDADELRVWTTDLRDGTPLADVSVQLLGDANQIAGTDGNAPPTDPVASDVDGAAKIALSGVARTLIVAKKGDDVAILPSDFYGGWWQRLPVLDEPRWSVFDDRGIYRPGETVSVKGWVRRFTTSADGQLRLPDAGATVTYTAADAQGNQIAAGSATVGPLGGFDLTFVVPADANLGYAALQLALEGVSGLNNPYFGHQFQIEEFRRPEYEVTARHESDGPYVQGAPLTVAVDADYYSGGPLAAAPVDWSVTTAAATYSPPGWDEFTFGRWTPWWYPDSGYLDGFAGGRPAGNPTSSVGPCCDGVGADATTATYSATTDGNGTNYLQIDAGSLDEATVGLPVTVSAQATVTDVNRQALASTTSVLVHPADFYVGLRGENTYVDEGRPLSVDVIATDIDGAAVAGRAIHVTSTRSVSVFADGQWIDKAADLQSCDLASAATPTTCALPTSGGGTYTITATVTDDAGRQSRTELTRWVSGQQVAPTRNVEEESLTLVPDKAEYAPGDTAQILVQSPFATGHGTVTLARAGQLASTIHFDLTGGSAIVPVPVADTDIPGFDASIEVVGAAPRAGDDGSIATDAPERPAYATGSLTLDVSTATRTLTVTAAPRPDTVLPGGDTQVAITVTDNAGAPVEGSELAVVVVDEAVLALTDHQLDDPLATFYARLPSYLSAQYGRRTIVLTDPATVTADPNQTSATTADTTAAATAATVPGLGGAAADGSGGKNATPAPGALFSAAATTGAAIDVRTNFDALAVFEPSVLTDAAGQATVDVPLPDNLTRYRVMVVAVAGADHFGSAEANITARLPLMVRPSPPRLLNFGDTFELPIVVQNQTDAAMDVDVVLQTDNLVATGDLVLAGTGAGQRVTVPGNDRVEVRFPVSAAQVGTARFRVAVANPAGAEADAATIELPVYSPATAEAFATYGVIDDGATLQPVAAPTDVIPEFGGLDITTSSTSLQALTDAMLYITDYPYQSSDAMASRILAIASLRGVLEAFDAPGLPAPDALDAAVGADIRGLVALQNGDGGFAYWEPGKPSDPYNSIQVTHALVVARDGGFDVPQASIDAALAFLADIEQHIPAEYGRDARDTLSAYALNVRMLAGDRDPAKAGALFESRREALPLDAVAWLWPVVDGADVGAIETIIGNRAVDTAGAVTFTTAAQDDDYVTLRSDRRTDGLILDALIAVRPQSGLIPKAVAGLLAAQSQGRWDNIQENSFILLALKRYFDVYESQTPDFVARVWLGNRFAGEHTFTGRSTDRVRISVPTSDLIASATAGHDAALVIEKAGTGRLYYRIGLRTAPADLHLDPLDRGFVVQRTYEAVDDPGDVTRDADGTWHITAGALVRVRLTMVAESQRTHVALIDPLPAGLEVLNSSLATSPDAPVDPTAPSGGYDTASSSAGSLAPWYPTWYDHQNRRDDRVEAYSTYLGAGTYDYSYVATATTPGTFVAPPTRAEEMYAPETFGRAGTDTVVIAG